MTQSSEAVLILGIILTMMVADLFYNGAMLSLHGRWSELGCTSTIGSYTGVCASVSDIIAPLGPVTKGGIQFEWNAPIASALALGMSTLPFGLLVLIAHAGFWTHSALVLVFLNILPYSKHFHIITAIPNVFLRNLEPGKLSTMAAGTEKMMEVVEVATSKEDVLEDAVGVARIEHFSWKSILDFYTCTECGRCSDNCPAHRTGKLLSPKQFTLNLRDHLYEREGELVPHYVGAVENRSPIGAKLKAERIAEATEAGVEVPAEEPVYKPVNLVGDIIHPDVLWGCTACRACEEQCPVMISYVDKIIDMRRNLVTIQGEFPPELQRPFSGMETNGNPWNLARVDRGAWTEGLGIKTMAENPNAKVLYWVGCAASYDDRAKKIARAMARLLQKAGVDFAILGEEETCTGDPARRAGNEFLFLTLAEQNSSTLNGYKEQGGITQIVTTCPHGFNTLRNEYPEFGAKFEVLHHTDYLLDLLQKGKLKPSKSAKGKIVYHDSCYLGRYNEIYDSPREILKSIPGAELVEPEYWTRNKGMCCGAGGAQMWMEEQNKDRINVKRTLQLVETQAKTVASACPFCMTMLTDGLKSQQLEGDIRQLDIAEILAESCLDAEN